MDDPKRTIVIASGANHRTLLALEAVASSLEPLLGDGKYDREPYTAQLGEGETNDAFFEEIASLNGVDYAEVERRFMVLGPKAFMREVPISGREGYVVVDELIGVELATMKPPYEGNRKERRAQAARARDKRWRIKL